MSMSMYCMLGIAMVVTTHCRYGANLGSVALSVSSTQS